jgi:hypothetical protein
MEPDPTDRNIFRPTAHSLSPAGDGRQAPAGLGEAMAAAAGQAGQLAALQLAAAQALGPGRGDAQRAGEIDRLLSLGQLPQAQALLHDWLELYRLELRTLPSRQRARRAELWRVLADVVERTADQRLLEHFWTSIEGLPSPQGGSAVEAPIPLLGIPILNGADRLEQCLASLDRPVTTLALVDNSGGAGPVRRLLDGLEGGGHPLVERVRVARPFHNLGVAASWNLILRSFPEAGYALILNHDVALSPGALGQALASLRPARPQWLPLLPGSDAFSAFLLTAPAWDRVGFFEEAFHPAYFEDLDYRDRLAADPQIELIEQGPWLEAMAAANTAGSATLADDPRLREANRASYQLNRLWYLSRRRHQGRHQGYWRRLWLAGWTP